MRSVSRTLVMVMMMAALAVPTLAQNAEEPVPQTGLGLAMLLLGLLSIVVVGGMLARREAQGNEEDLV